MGYSAASIVVIMKFHVIRMYSYTTIFLRWIFKLLLIPGVQTFKDFFFDESLWGYGK